MVSIANLTLVVSVVVSVVAVVSVVVSVVAVVAVVAVFAVVVLLLAQTTCCVWLLFGLLREASNAIATASAIVLAKATVSATSIVTEAQWMAR